MNSSGNRNQEYEEFLRQVATKVDDLLNKPKKLAVFKKHTDKVIREAKKYRKYLHAKYNNARKKNFLVYDEKPKGDNYFWFSSCNLTTEYTTNFDYFNGDTVTFWMKGQPKLDALDYVYSIARGCVGTLHEYLTLLDYQYFLLTCIHDSQRWAAGQSLIYFERLDEKELKNRICKDVWNAFNRNDIDLNTLKTIRTTIKLACQAVCADLAENNAIFAILCRIWTCIKKIPRWIYYILGALAALLTVLHLLGWLQPIKDFVSKIL